jgi:prepilin-type N-terminal cleavage/methylation domain-containing protein/prepilin-type processing-associated H-X9-DG protein
MQVKKGFTLIELLVVIAIIAILAAILFPVFANARDKARQITGVSNLKQVALAALMYTSDNDEAFPIGCGGGAPDGSNWIQGISPYLGTIKVLFGPNDTSANQVVSGYGVSISIGANAIGSYEGTSSTWTRLGVFAGNNNYDPNPGNGYTCKSSEVTQPSSTILFCDLSAKDLLSVPSRDGGWAGVVDATTGFATTSLIGTPAQYPNSSADSSLGKLAYNLAFPGDTTYGSQGWWTPSGEALWAIPNPKRSPTNVYPEGPNGLVSTPYSSKTLTNFAFVDGHVKSQKPVATNPDGVVFTGTTGSLVPDSNNQWIASR